MKKFHNLEKSNMQFNLQPKLENENIILLPLQEDDFEALYAVACDPKIWEQHPNKNRWQRNVFQNYFKKVKAH